MHVDARFILCTCCKLKQRKKEIKTEKDTETKEERKVVRLSFLPTQHGHIDKEEKQIPPAYMQAEEKSVLSGKQQKTKSTTGRGEKTHKSTQKKQE